METPLKTFEISAIRWGLGKVFKSVDRILAYSFVKIRS